MNKLMIPPNPNWFAQSCCYGTPNNGLIYGAMTKIVYIPPKTENADEIKVVDLKNKLCSFSIAPDWNESKLFAIINADFTVLVYDFEAGVAVKGHKGHEKENNAVNKSSAHTAIAFLKQNCVLSSVNSNLIHYCLVTNTIKIFLDFSSRNPITIFKQSPKDPNMIAAGTKNGLILLIAFDKMEIVAKLRGHDTEISSLDWMYLSMKPVPEVAPVADKVTLENLIASTDTSDCFDIYVENEETEFGVYGGSVESRSDDEETNQGELQEKIVSNSNFNFLEACNNLKGDILAEDDKPKGDAPTDGTFEENKEQYGVKNEDNLSADESLESNASSRTPVLTEESLNFLEEAQRMKDFVIVSKEDVAQVEDIPVLASGSREQIAWLWDINERTAFCKIKWHPKTRPSLPTPFTNVLWIDQATLLVTDGNGDIIEYKVSLDVNTKTLTAKEQKERKFDAKGVLNMCKSDEGSVVWTSSIHRHISCLSVARDYEKIISLDTIQLRIHNIVENPIDSNVIAIGGNDKRICLWNTSEASSDAITLRPFMNKIQSGVLCLSWHPDKDNILAFSTREGRIGVLDTNKSSNVPTILASFSSQEVYSIAWAKIEADDSVVLVACNGHKLVCYSQKDQWKMRNVDHLKNSSSIAVSGSLMAVGNGNGDVSIADIGRNFYILFKKKVCKKYIGMMTWHGSTLAVASESGITVIKDVTASISELADDCLVKLQGHKGRVFSVRFNKAGDLLVSCCVSGHVKVWDLSTMLPVSGFSINTMAYSAIFLPSNEDVIVCGGQDSTVLMINWRQHCSDTEPEVGSKKKQNYVKNIQWATATQITTGSKNSNRRHKKKIEKFAEQEITELSTDIVKLNLQPKKGFSIFHQANRELTTNPLELIEKMLSDEDREMCFNEKIFGDREHVKSMIEKESEQNKKAQGAVVFPQLNDSLKSDIIERIANKTLTEVHVAVAPSVSFDIWRKCCVAYGNQCLDNDDSLSAVPYFLAVNDVDNCINQLCDGKYFREAWVIAKMRKDQSDPVFEKIIAQWIAHFDYSGSYEAGAALLTCKRDFKAAVELLEKRQNKTEKCAQIVKLLISKTA